MIGYLDIQEGDEVVRKRIGDLIVYETAEELIAEGNTAVNGTVGPWSKTALYYVVESNALLKWTGSVWKQINSVSDIEGNITQLDDIVRGENGLVSQVADLDSSIDAINDSTNGILAQAKSDATTKANQALKMSNAFIITFPLSLSFCSISYLSEDAVIISFVSTVVCSYRGATYFIVLPPCLRCHYMTRNSIFLPH